MTIQFDGLLILCMNIKEVSLEIVEKKLQARYICYTHIIDRSSKWEIQGKVLEW